MKVLFINTTVKNKLFYKTIFFSLFKLFNFQEIYINKFINGPECFA